MKISKRINNLEARLCSKSLDIPKEGSECTIEIVEWWKHDEACHVIAFFKAKSEHDWDLEFVGARPFAITVSQEDFMNLARASYDYLKAVQSFL